MQLVKNVKGAANILKNAEKVDAWLKNNLVPNEGWDRGGDWWSEVFSLTPTSINTHKRHMTRL